MTDEREPGRVTATSMTVMLGETPTYIVLVAGDEPATQVRRVGTSSRLEALRSSVKDRGGVMPSYGDFIQNGRPLDALSASARSPFSLPQSL